MKSTEIKFTAIPSTEEVKAERDRLAYRSRYGRVLRSTIYALVVVAAVAVLLATLFLPVLQVSGDSMNPTLEDKDILLLVKSDSMKTGDLCGFYWQNKLLLKRVIGQPGDVISMDEDGHVTVNGTVLDEPYVDELALGECAMVVIETPEGHTVMARQIAGAIARRIVTYAEVGEDCYIDEHMGFIKFGSRVDVYLPLGTEVCVKMGQATVGNETVIAKLK